MTRDSGKKTGNRIKKERKGAEKRNPTWHLEEKVKLEKWNGNEMKTRKTRWKVIVWHVTVGRKGEIKENREERSGVKESHVTDGGKWEIAENGMEIRWEIGKPSGRWRKVYNCRIWNGNKLEKKESWIKSNYSYLGKEKMKWKNMEYK